MRRQTKPEAWPEIDALLPFESTSPEETARLGARLGEAFRPGDVVALYGALGAGKTYLAKGICRAFGVPEPSVSSPTFALVQEYAGGGLPIYHFDAYRITRAEEWFDLGYEEYFYGEGLCLIEWPERIEALLPPYALRLGLHHLGGDRRRIERPAT